MAGLSALNLKMSGRPVTLAGATLLLWLGGQDGLLAQFDRRQSTSIRELAKRLQEGMQAAARACLATAGQDGTSVPSEELPPAVEVALEMLMAA